MPPNTRKSKVEVENHGMVLRKRQSNIFPPTTQRKAFNEIGNVVQRYNARGSICMDTLKNCDKTMRESKPSSQSRKSVASVSTIRQSISFKASEPLAAECKALGKNTQDNLTTSVPSNRQFTTQTKENRQAESRDRILPPPMAPPPSVWRVKRNSAAVKRLPRLTFKPFPTPETLSADNKRRESCSYHPRRRLTLKPPQPTPANTSATPTLPELKKKKKPCDINAKDDIDLMHKGCPWMMSAYAKCIYSYLQKLELKLAIRKSVIKAPVVTEEMRTTMVGWLACVYHQLRLLQETYLLSVSLLDRYLMRSESIEKDKLQLVALICLCLGIKFEEAIPGSIKEMLKLTKDAYTKEQFLKMEADVIQVLDFQICRPVSITFLRRFNLAARCDRVQHTYGKYLIDLAQLDIDLAYERPSCLAAAAVFVGMCITRSEVNSQFWNPVLHHYTSYNLHDIQPVVSQLATIAINGGGHQSYIRKRYSSETNYRVTEKVEQQLSLLQKLR